MVLAYYDGFLTHLFSLWVFITFMVGTPGPANLLIMTIGSKYGMGTAMRFNVGLVSKFGDGDWRWSVFDKPTCLA